MSNAMVPARRARVVDEMVVHGEPIDFRELCVRAISTDARTLLLDLDRTVHLDRNMGELLGWEICAHRGYGPERLAQLEPGRGRGRFALDWTSPRALLRYLAVGARMWTGPGLYYLLWGKLAWQSAALRRLSYLTLGPEPVSAAQRVPQTALMHHMAELPLPALRDLAARVFRRYAPDQVILRDDIAWLRRRSPSLRIILTSASPGPMVEVAAEELGVDDAVSSTIEEHDGRLSAPAQRSRMFLPARAPRRISPPEAVRINGSHAKIEELDRRFPGVVASSAAGITDTGYGEDHCWARHLGCVVDVNSSAPFPPIVDACSPLRSIHSAAVLTRAERCARDAGSRRLDPRRARVRTHGPVALSEEQLDLELADLVVEVDALMASVAEAERACDAARARAEGELREVAARAAVIVDAYNAGETEAERRDALERLDAVVREERRARRDVVRALRPVGEAACSLTAALASARARVERLVDGSAGTAVREVWS